MDEIHIRARFGAGVLGGRVHAHDIARNEFEILEGKDRGVVHLLAALFLQHAHGFFVATVDGIMHGDIVEAELAVGIHRDGDLLDGAGAIITARLDEAHFRRIGFAGFDKKVVRDPQSLSLFIGGNVILPVLIDVHSALVQVALAAAKLDLFVIQHQTAIAHRAVRQDFQVRLGTFHGAQVAAAFFDLIFQSGPGGEPVGHTNLFDRWQINYF